MARRNGWSVCGTACAMVYGLLLAPSVWAQPPLYTVVELADRNTNQSRAIDINANGQVVGLAKPGGLTRAFLWADGGGTRLDSLTNGGEDVALGINASGQTVGYSRDFRATAFLWNDGTLTNLGALLTKSGPESYAFDINARGQVVGQVSYGVGGLLRTRRAALWANGTLTELATLYEGSRDFEVTDLALAINDSGQIVGWVFSESGYRAALWQNGTVADLGTLGGRNSQAHDINASGHVVGEAQLPDAAPTNGATRACLWKDGVRMNLGTLGDSTSLSSASGINAAGQVVGRSTLNRTAATTRGFLWRDGVMYDLNALTAGSGWTITEATAVNDDGQIAAVGDRGDGVQRALLLNPPGLSPPPPPAYTLYLAEGATSSFFNTYFALLNPGGIPTRTMLTFTLANGQAITRELTIPGRTRATYIPKFPGLEAAEFATRIDSNRRLVVDRTMTWDKTGYGSHSETAVGAPATTWYLAEGATIGGFSLFYLLQNPAATPTAVQVRYLRTVGAPLVKTYVLPARSRTNIWVNEEEFAGVGKALASAEFSAVIESQDSTPIIVERAMYRSNQGRVFNAGHASMGVTAPATDWFLAEGATGPFFDMFVLIANPTATDAQVTVTYLTVGGITYSRNLVARANSRSGIWVDQEEFPGVAGKPLANAAVSTTVQSTNGVPLVVERAMWWPGDSSTWHEAHNSAGATATGTKWAVAEGAIDVSRGHETYLMIANTSAFAGNAMVTLMFEDGTSVTRTYPLPALSRTNVAVGPEFGDAVINRRFGAVIESTGGTPAQIVVERAMYSNNFAAGTNALATKLQ